MAVSVFPETLHGPERTLKETLSPELAVALSDDEPPSHVKSEGWEKLIVCSAAETVSELDPPLGSKLGSPAKDALTAAG